MPLCTHVLEAAQEEAMCSQAFLDGAESPFDQGRTYLVQISRLLQLHLLTMCPDDGFICTDMNGTSIASLAALVTTEAPCALTAAIHVHIVAFTTALRCV